MTPFSDFNYEDMNEVKILSKGNIEILDGDICFKNKLVWIIFTLKINRTVLTQNLISVTHSHWVDYDKVKQKINQCLLDKTIINQIDVLA